MLGKILATLRKSNAILYATVSQVIDIKLNNNNIILIFDASTLKEECEKHENMQQLNSIVKNLDAQYNIQCQLQIKSKNEINVIQLLKDEFDDLLIIQNKGEKNV